MCTKRTDRIRLGHRRCRQEGATATRSCTRSSSQRATFHKSVEPAVTSVCTRSSHYRVPTRLSRGGSGMNWRATRLPPNLTPSTRPTTSSVSKPRSRRQTRWVRANSIKAKSARILQQAALFSHDRRVLIAVHKYFSVKIPLRGATWFFFTTHFRGYTKLIPRENGIFTPALWKLTLCYSILRQLCNIAIITIY